MGVTTSIIKAAAKAAAKAKAAKRKPLTPSDRAARAKKFSYSPEGKAAAAKAEARAAATPTAKKTRYGPDKKKKPPAGRKIPDYSGDNISSYKEAIMIKEGLNTWPSTRDPFPKSKTEFKVWDKVGSYKK